MADTTEGSFPNTFLGKLTYMAGPLVLTLLLAVGIGFLIVWVWAGKIDEKMKAEREERMKAEKALAADLDVAKKDFASKLDKQRQEFDTKVADLKVENDKLAGKLKDAEQTIIKVSDSLAATSRMFEGFKTEQKTVDSQQNTSIADNSRRIQYVEQQLKRLDAVEKDVDKLFAQDEEMQRHYVALRKELTLVRDRGAVTEEQLNGLSERTRVFQLRVLAARAKQAADAAREGDLKQLLARLTD
jgi:chromosome segregation ATPase